MSTAGSWIDSARCRCYKGTLAAGSSASNAYTELCIVAIKSTLRVVPPTTKLGTTRVCAYTLPSTRRSNNLPKLVLLTLAFVSWISVRFAPESLCVESHNKIALMNYEPVLDGVGELTSDG